MRSGDAGAWGSQERRDAFAAVEGSTFDVLVIGGGVVGCGAALDAATRGLRVALVEAHDFGSGTSSRSSKLIHGGLRYLEQLDFALVREALRERSLILGSLAPHLARPVPFLYPLTHRGWERPYVGSGVLLYDTLGGRHGVPSHRHLSKRRALEEFPSLRPDALVGAVRYYDGQVDDARYTMFLARTAAHYGAVCLSRARSEELVREGDRVVGAWIRDEETGERHQVRARHVVNATGAWTGESLRGSGRPAPFSVRASKGVHLVVPRDRIDASVGMISRTEKSVLFIIPWDEHWLVGTTDTPWEVETRDVVATRRDVDYLLECANRLLREPLTRADVVGVYAGLRPLLAGDTDETTKLSREHAVASPAPGLTVVAGGKYTTYRVMARDAIDAALADATSGAASSCTERIPLLGAEGYEAAWNSRRQLARASGLPVGRVERLLHRYGTLTTHLLDLVRRDPRLAEPVAGAEAYLAVEVHYAAAAEGALHLDDVLVRRTHIAIETRDRGRIAAQRCAEIVAPVLGWDDETLGHEVAVYRERVEAELEAEAAGDDFIATAAIERRRGGRPVVAG